MSSLIVLAVFICLTFAFAIMLEKTKSGKKILGIFLEKNGAATNGAIALFIFLLLLIVCQNSLPEMISTWIFFIVVPFSVAVALLGMEAKGII